MEGNGDDPRIIGLTESQVRERLSQAAETRMPETMDDADAFGRALAGLIARVTALQEVAIFLAAEIDSLRHQSDPPR